VFGSNFAAQFGLPGPPWEVLDSYNGIFGPTGTVTPLPGSQLSGEDQVKAGPVATTAQAPVAGMPGVQPQAGPQAPPIISGDFTPQTFYDDPATFYQGGPGSQGGQEDTAKALSPGPLALPAGLTSEFAKKG
jgi:hypothetical protein